MEPIEYYIPSIDFNYIEKENINTFLSLYKNKLKILVSNGKTLSGQAFNFDFNPILSELSEKYKDVVFIATDDSNKILKENLYYTRDIINLNCDLNEIAYLSTFCDIIIGRSSGPYSFTHIKENINNCDKIFVCFTKTKIDSAFFYSNKCQYIWNNSDNQNDIVNIIKETLNKKIIL